MKKIFLWIVVLFIIGFLPIPLVAEENNKVIVYYFHTSFRCASCHTIEQYTEEAIKAHFAQAIESGTLEYRVVNTEEKENEHFVREYNLYTKSVVLSLVKDGKEAKFKNLDQVWQLLRNKDAFHQYIRTETRAFLDSLQEDQRT